MDGNVMLQVKADTTTTGSTKPAVTATATSDTESISDHISLADKPNDRQVLLLRCYVWSN